LNVPEQTTNPRLRMLIVDDSEDDALLMMHRFRQAGYRCEFERVYSGGAMREALAHGPWDVVLCDHMMPRFSSLDALALLQEMGQDLPFIIVSGLIDEETAVAAMRAGAHDYLSKDKPHRLIPAVERELREARNRAERRAALDAVRENEARLRALATNIPGMVFQMARDPEGLVRFLYVSEGATPVLGVRSGELMREPWRFLDMMPDPDRRRFLEAVTGSQGMLAALNWDGQVRTPEGDLKWINLRSSPRRIDSGDLVWDGVAFNITQSKDTERELRQSRAQLAELSSHLEAAKEDERERIARDIHDELGGTLVAVKFEVALLATKIPKRSAALRERVRSVEGLVDNAIATAGRVARELRPGILKEFGLAAAIECQAEDFTQRTGIACQVLCADHDIDVDKDTSTALFRIFQEALTNVNKHARATRVEVRLYQEGGDVLFEVCDDGRGIAPGDLSKPRSFGLRGMRERIGGLRGTLEIEGRRPSGTRLAVRAPAHPTAAQPS
jgi:PAS domain S-box-containing protein